jgi:regulator of replication initiation timing
MDKITEALKKILPAEQVSEVCEAVKEMMAAEAAATHAAASAKLEEAYAQLSNEMGQMETVAEQGYQQAYEIINSLMKRLDEQREEFEQALEEGFEEAFQELEKEKGKNGTIEVELYEEFDKKLKEMKEFMVDKLDQFLSLQEQEIYEAAERNVLTDPRTVEQRVIVSKMAEMLSDYMNNDDFSRVSSSRLEETSKQLDALKGQLRIMEAKNVNLSRQNNKLTEQVSEANGLLTEAAKTERKERAGKAKQVSGRGQRVAADQIVSEYAAPTNSNSNDQDLREDNDPLNDLLVLSGLQAS